MQTEEPHDVDVYGVGFRGKRVAGRQGELCSIGDRSQLQRDLLEEPDGRLSRIGLEGLVAFYQECGDCCGEYTRLEVDQCEYIKATKFNRTHVNEDPIHICLPTLDHRRVMLICLCDAESPHLGGGIIEVSIVFSQRRQSLVYVYMM